MSKPINDDNVIHDGHKARCPYCHQELVNAKFSNIKTGESYRKWCHVKNRGTSMQAYKDDCDLSEKSRNTGNEILSDPKLEDIHKLDINNN